jgi:hypothetical protein
LQTSEYFAREPVHPILGRILEGLPDCQELTGRKPAAQGFLQTDERFLSEENSYAKKE